MIIKCLSNTMKRILILIGILLGLNESQLFSTNEFYLSNALFNKSKEDTTILQEFLMDLLANTECGYVLYGKKPLCFIGIKRVGRDFVGMIGHYHSVAISNGIQAWENLQLPKESKNYILHISSDPSEKNPVFIMINRSAFLQAVNENLSLFQYILGPEVTAAKLLNKLTRPDTGV